MADRRKKMGLAARADAFADRHAPRHSFSLDQRRALMSWMRFAFMRGYHAAKRDARNEIGVDLGKPGGDKTVEVRGHRDASGTLHIDSIEEQSPSYKERPNP